MDPLLLLVLVSVALPSTHLVMSWGPVRRPLVASIGEWPFRGAYSLVAMACLIGMILVYRDNRHLGAVLWDLPSWVELAVALPLMLVAVLLVIPAFARPSPASMAPVEVRAVGLLRVTRHPLNIGLASFGLAHVVANGAVGDVLFFGSFVVLGVVGAVHQDQRKKEQLGAPYETFLEQTSIVPFWAAIRGRTKLAASELPWWLIGAALLVLGALILLHERAFGVGLLRL